jgi:hypothetical protein
MRILSGLLMVAALALWSGVDAGEKDKKEVTLKGLITCPKCDLGIEKACWTVIVVKQDKKETIYHFDKESNKKYHNDICTSGKKGQVTGTVAKEGKKSVVSVKSLKYD